MKSLFSTKKNIFFQNIHMDTWNAILTNRLSDKKSNLFCSFFRNDKKLGILASKAHQNVPRVT